ncbi:putative 5xTM membrane YitT family protein [Roseinatronobacter thiooxidans]|uniref:Putative 5xTM membrane YitT family protein n=1 Tax=Roseinatronobacter thiooxidans TaxID=121821 RepID=A0A2W7PV86_9RHOB|nr:YitT family protein [Roseinatronobacter thiooxidans]PZX39366.1 putative 5xTM membrane YitT family protein [Roseinatronobacter thiooxidans]
MTASAPHTKFEDAQGLVFGAVMCAFGVLILTGAGLVTGQTAGLAVLVAYITGYSFGVVFFAINIPFYALAWWRLGRAFTVKTFVSVALISAISLVIEDLVQVDPAHPAVAAVLFGLIAGAGLLAIFRHRASLGGVGIVAYDLQERFGWRAGWVQLAFDLALFAVALLVLDPDLVLWSLLGAAVLNAIVAINHRRDRYIGT